MHRENVRRATADMPRATDDATNEARSTVESSVSVGFADVPPAIQFAIATPLYEAADLMYQAAELIHTTFSAGNLTPGAMTLSEGGNYYQIESAMTRLESVASSLERATQNQKDSTEIMSEKGVKLKLEQTITAKSTFQSATSYLRR
jgi:hypothetical protein